MSTRRRAKPPVDSCAFLPCDQVERCALAPRCVAKAFPQPVKAGDTAGLKDNAPALVGTKPGRTKRLTSK